MSEEIILKEFREKWEGANTGGHSSISTPVMDEILSDITQALQAKEKEVREEIAREVEKKKLPIPNPYGNVVRVEKYNEVMDSLISIINKK